MSKFVLSNKNTLKSKLMRGVTLGVAGLVFYSGFLGIEYATDRMDYNRKYKNIVSAITLGDEDLARNRFEAFKESGDLSVEESINIGYLINNRFKELNLKNQKDIIVDSFNEALDDHNYSLAKDIFDSKMSDSDLNKNQIKDFENILYGYSDQGFFEKIGKSDQEERKILAKEYLLFYPGGKNKSRVVEWMVGDTLDSVLKSMNRYSNFDDFYKEFVEVNTLIEKYSDVDLPEGLFNEGIENEFRTCLNRSVNHHKGKKISLGDKVMLDEVSNSVTYYDKDYKDQRNSLFARGSFGNVIAFQDEGKDIIVEFDSSRKYSWRSSWSDIKKYWGENHNAAKYHRGWSDSTKTELKVVSDITDVQKERFKLEIEKIKSYLK